MLVSALNSHPQINCHGELLRKQAVGLTGALSIVRQIDKEYHAPEYRHGNPMQYLDAVFRVDKSTPFWGFKLLCNQNKRAWRRVAINPRWKCIILYRDNLLAAYSSGLIAAATGQGIAHAGDDILKKEVEFKPDDFTRFMAKRSAQLESLKQLMADNDGDYIETRYLEITTADGIRKVLEFIGADPSRLARPTTAKRNTSTILKRFSNPAEVESHLKAIGKLDWAEEQPH